MDIYSEHEVAVRRPRLLVRMALGLCVLATVGFFSLVVASYYGHIWTPLDAFSHLRVHLLGGFFGFGLASLSLLTVQKLRIAVLILFLAAIGTILYAAFWPALSQGSHYELAADPTETEFKLISYNTWTRNKTPEKIVEFLNGENADIVVLVEFPRRNRKLLQLLRKRYPFQHVCNDKSYCQIVVLSRIPFQASGSRSNWEGPNVVWARFGKALGGLTVFGVHFTRPFYPNWHWSQMRAMAKETFTAQGPFVVAGDFNATKDSFLINAFQEFAGLLRITSVPSPLPSMAHRRSPR